MHIGETVFGLDIPVSRVSRYAARGVPGVELRIAGPACIFHRVIGVIDSGASLTLLTTSTARLLGLVTSKSDYWERIEAVGGAVEYVREWVQFRFALGGKPPVNFFLRAGVAPHVRDNLFGSDLLQYFFILLGTHTVHFLADVDPRKASRR